MMGGVHHVRHSIEMTAMWNRCRRMIETPAQYVVVLQRRGEAIAKADHDQASDCRRGLAGIVWRCLTISNCFAGACSDQME